jgi:hypothetical protein
MKRVVYSPRRPTVAFNIAHTHLQVFDNTANVGNLGLHHTKVLRRLIPNAFNSSFVKVAVPTKL